MGTAWGSINGAPTRWLSRATAIGRSCCFITLAPRSNSWTTRPLRLLWPKIPPPRCPTPAPPALGGDGSTRCFVDGPMRPCVPHASTGTPRVIVSPGPRLLTSPLDIRAGPQERNLLRHSSSAVLPNFDAVRLDAFRPSTSIRDCISNDADGGCRPEFERGTIVSRHVYRDGGRNGPGRGDSHAVPDCE